MVHTPRPASSKSKSVAASSIHSPLHSAPQITPTVCPCCTELPTDKPIFQWSTGIMLRRVVNQQTSGHSKQLKRFRPDVHAFKYAFLPRTIPAWNAPPCEVVDADWIYSNNFMPTSFAPIIRFTHRVTACVHCVNTFSAPSSTPVPCTVDCHCCSP